jgi:thiamine-phosphate pyrophosphorylase|tara:strand:+ start:453 stop:1028 length:576 start_codon:yes stop_codon:yes gene_type:complete
MFILKKKYFLIIESIKDINLRNIKKYNKFSIIYRNQKTKDNLKDLITFRKLCKLKTVDFYVTNNIKLAVFLNSDGIYLSAYNKTFKALNLKKLNYKIIGSAHNVKEIFFKIRQGCSYILLSKLFLVDYDKKSPFLGIIKFNSLLKTFSNNLVPLGGIKISNLNDLKNLNCNSFAILSEVKKKPANIINRLF